MHRRICILYVYGPYTLNVCEFITLLLVIIYCANSLYAVGVSCKFRRQTRKKNRPTDALKTIYVRMFRCARIPEHLDELSLLDSIKIDFSSFCARLPLKRWANLALIGKSCLNSHTHTSAQNLLKESKEAYVLHISYMDLDIRSFAFQQHTRYDNKLSCVCACVL